MQHATPSRTALRVALRRAAHQVQDARPLVFDDPLAVRILGPEYAEEIARTPDAERRPFSAALRAWMVSRARMAEDALAAAVAAQADAVQSQQKLPPQPAQPVPPPQPAQHVPPAQPAQHVPPAQPAQHVQLAQPGDRLQYLVLGAGLDTFAYRHAYANVRVFEVDHPATQAWKLDRLRAAEIAVPATMRHVPVDFERQNLAEELAAAGFDAALPTVTAWLGVVPYLTLEAFRATATLLGSFAAGSEVVFDYAQPREVLPEREQQMQDSLAARVALAGEPFQLYFTADALREELARCGLAVKQDIGSAEITARYLSNRTDRLTLRGQAARICSARPVQR
jgi:methyltransferase (TIGR00027 family)